MSSEQNQGTSRASRYFLLAAILLAVAWLTSRRDAARMETTALTASSSVAMPDAAPGGADGLGGGAAGLSNDLDPGSADPSGRDGRPRAGSRPAGFGAGASEGAASRASAAGSGDSAMSPTARYLGAAGSGGSSGSSASSFDGGGGASRASADRFVRMKGESGGLVPAGAEPASRVAAAGPGAAANPGAKNLKNDTVRREEPKIQQVWLKYWHQHPVVRQYEKDWFANKDLASLTEGYIQKHDPIAFMYGLASSASFRDLASQYMREPVMLALMRDAILAASYGAIAEASGVLTGHSKLSGFVMDVDKKVRTASDDTFSPVDEALPSATPENTKMRLPAKLNFEKGLRPIKSS